MFRTDSISKNFLNGHGQFLPFNLSSKPDVGRWLQLDDPTYLGFWIRLQPEIALAQSNNIYNVDYLPQGLLIPDNIGDTDIARQQQADSIVGYFRRRNEYYRAKMMEEFQQGFTRIFSKAPWMIQKISGVEGLWKINPANNWRTKDVVITLECLETIDLKMTYLLDLYRKAVWDATFHRWAAPDCQRFFTMDIIVAEIRTMQRPRQTIGLSTSSSNTEPYNIGTFHKYRCEYCEIDPFSEEPGYLSSLNAFAENAASVKFKIKVGAVTELNTYGLLGAYLQDTKFAFQRGKEFRDQSIQGEKLDTQRLSGIPNDFLALIQTNLTNAANSLISRAANKIFLGNVYQLSLSDARNALDRVARNPAAAAQGLLNNAGVSGPVAADLSQGIELSGPDIELIQGTIGDIDLISSAVAGTSLENQSVESIINTIASGRLVNPIGKVELTSYDGTTESPQAVNFSAPNKNQNIDPLRLVLENNGASTAGNPNRVTFVAPNVVTGNPGSVELTAPDKNTTSDSKVDLTAPDKNTTSDNKVELQAADVSGNGEKQVELTAPPISTDVESKVLLESAEPSSSAPVKVEFVETFKPELQGGSVELESPEIPPLQNASVDLIAPTKPVASEASVDLIAPTKPVASEASVDLIAPTINNNVEQNIMFDSANINISSGNVGSVEFTDTFTPGKIEEKIVLEAPSISKNTEANVNFTGVENNLIKTDLGTENLE